MRSTLPKRAARPRGFTLVETLVAIGIMIALLGLLFPMVGNIRAGAISTQCLNNLRQLGSAVDSYRLSNKGTMPMADFLPLVTDAGPEGGLPELLKATIDPRSEAWICPADIDDESLATGTSYYYMPGLLRYSPQIQIPVAQALLPMMLDGTLSQSQIDRQRTRLEARLVSNFYENANEARRFAILSDSQDRHPIGDRNPRNGLFRDGSVGAMPTAEEIADDLGEGPPSEAEP
ncbi:MAG: type II secretion system protein [Phycisphaerales bacterium]|jgi:type II secretory pathway pseudopilin PulG